MEIDNYLPKPPVSEPANGKTESPVLSREVSQQPESVSPVQDYPYYPGLRTRRAKPRLGKKNYGAY